MTTVAAELQAQSTTAPQVRRGSDRMWIDVLNTVAGELRRRPTSAGGNKAELLRTTLIAGGGIPAHLMAK